MPEADLEVDARGLYCPIPVLRLAKALRARPSGTVASLVATDPAAIEDVRAFCREGNHLLLGEQREGELLRFWIRKA